MKRCPQCRRDYTDETLNFCLDDGAALVDGPASMDEPVTAVFGVPPSGGSVDNEKTRLFENRQTNDNPQSAIRDPQSGRLNEGGTQRAGLPSSGVSWIATRAFQRKVFLAAAAAILILLGGFLSYRYFSSGRNAIDSIAVLPFVNDTGSADAEYLSDGMTEMLISRLSQVPAVSVKARSSVFRYKGKDTATPQIASELGVEGIITGRLAQLGDQYTITVELVEARNENVVWSRHYTRNPSDLVMLQNDIVRDVVKQLSTKLAPTSVNQLAASDTQNNEAYQNYLRGRFHWNKRSKEGLEKAIEYFNAAIAADPAYAVAYAGLADAHALGPFYADTDVTESFAKARAAAAKAIEIDGSLAEPFATLGHVKMWYDLDPKGAEADFKKAVELNPNYATARHWYSLFLATAGRHEEALAEIRRALELDPFSVSINLDLAVTHFYARQYDPAIAQFRRTAEMNPELLQTYIFLAETYEKKGEFENAITSWEKVMDLTRSPKSLTDRLREGLKQGREGYFRQKLAILHERWERRKAAAFEIAEAYATLNDGEKAFEWLNKAHETHDLSLATLRVAAGFDGLRSDPRYAEFLRRLGWT